MAKSWSKTKAPSRGREKFKIEEYVDLHKFTDRRWDQLRFVGPVTSIAQHWFDIRTKDGKKVTIPKACLNWNGDTESFDSNGCPYCSHDATKRVDISYYTNAIIRSIQDDEPRKKFPPVKDEKKVVNLGTKKEPFEAKLKSKDSRTWTPVRIVRIVPSLARQIADVPNRRTIKKKGREVEKDMEISHPRYGKDVEVKFDNSQSGTGKYQARGAKKSKLTEEELAYLVYPLDFHERAVETLEQATNEFKELKKRIVEGEGNKFDDDDDKPGKKDKKKKFKDKYDVEEDDEADDVDSDDEDEDEDAFKKLKDKYGKSKKSKSGSKTKSSSSKKKKKKSRD